MKTRLTITIDPAVVNKAKQLAYARKTNVSALVEELLRAAPEGKPESDFVGRWQGKFSVAKMPAEDIRMAHLKQKYGLSENLK